MLAPLDPNTKKILLVRSDRIGDLIITTPAIRAVREYFKTAQIDFLASDTNLAIVRTNPHINKVYELKLGNPLSWPGLLLQLRKQHYDIILCFNGASSKAAFFTRWANAKKTYARTNTKFAKYFDYPIFSEKTEHTTLAQLTFLNKLGIPSAGNKLEFLVPEDVKQTITAQYPRDPAKKRLAVFIGNAKKIHSRWPAEKFASLVETLLATPNTNEPGAKNMHAGPSEVAKNNAPEACFQPQLEIYLIHSKAETPLLAHFAAQKNLHIFSGNLTQTAAFLTTCDALLTSSSGPWHLAAAVGTPSLGILSQFSYNFWRPLEGKHPAVLTDKEAKDDKDVRPIEIKPVLEMVQNFFNNSN